MPTNILYEPMIAREKGLGYVGWMDRAGELFFPHVDTCCAVAVAFENNAIIGGHVPLVWGPKDGANASGNFKRIFDLIEVTRQNHVSKSKVRCLYAVGPEHWRRPFSDTLAKYDPAFSLEFPALQVMTDSTANGADVRLTTDLKTVSLTVIDFKTKAAKTYETPEETEEMRF